jgi:hypothetical protein
MTQSDVKPLKGDSNSAAKAQLLTQEEVDKMIAEALEESTEDEDKSDEEDKEEL